MKKRIVIIGSGESGVGAALLAQQQGFHVFVSDMGTIKPNYKNELIQHHIAFEENTHTHEQILNADEVIKSPGIADTYDIIQAINNKSIPIISEIEFAYRYAGGTIVAITGSNGKSTTTSLTHYILKQGGLDVACCGNIGKSFAREVYEGKKPYYVIELSSFQLDGIRDFRPHIAVILNFSEDHLYRYDNKMENYVQSKFRITMNQTENDVFIYWNEDEWTKFHFEKHGLPKAECIPFSTSSALTKGAYIMNNTLTINDKNHTTMSILDFALKGTHNAQNTMAASIIANRLGIKNETIKHSLESYKGLEHRLEKVNIINGIEYINDSKATNVNSAWFALETVEGPIIWIAGGQDEGNDYSSLIPLVKKKVKAIVCMGIDNRKIHEAFGNHVDLIANTASAEEAVKVATYFASKGDKVLLAPACKSFDLFKNFEDRGNQFKQAVFSLIN